VYQLDHAFNRVSHIRRSLDSTALEGIQFLTHLHNPLWRFSCASFHERQIILPEPLRQDVNRVCLLTAQVARRNAQSFGRFLLSQFLNVAAR